MWGPGGEAEKWHPKQPETYETWIPMSQPERPMVVGDKPPTISDVTLVKAPPSVRQEIYRDIVTEKIGESKAQPLYEKAERLYGVAGRLKGQAQELAELSHEIKVRAYEIKIGPPGLAEKMMQWQVPTTPLDWMKGAPVRGKKAPLAFPAGIVASGESFFYSALRLGGFWTPRPPPTLTGGLVGKGVELFTKDPTYELEKTMGYGGPYAFGTVVGDILMAKYVFGPVVTKAGGAIKAKAQSWLTTQYLEKGPATWKGITEKVVMKITGAKPYIATGEVAIPDISRGALSFSKLEASYGAWEMHLAPRTGGVWIGKYVLEEPAKKVLPVLIGYKGAVSIGYLGEYGFRRETALTPLVSQTQLTRMGIFPYVPKVGASTTVRGISQIFTGIAATSLVKVGKHLKPPQRKKFQFEPTFSFKRIQYSPLQVSFPTPTKQRDFPVIAPKFFDFAEVEQQTKQVSTLKQQVAQLPELKYQLKTPQILKQPSLPDIPDIPVAKTTPVFPVGPPFRLPTKGKRRKKKDLFGAWFKREHQIKMPKQMLETYLGSKMPRIGGKKR